MAKKVLLIIAIIIFILNMTLLILLFQSNRNAALSLATIDTDSTIKSHLNLSRIHKKPELINSDECKACHGDMKKTEQATKIDSDELNFHIHQTLKDKRFSCTYCHRSGRIISVLTKQTNQSNVLKTTLKTNNNFCLKCHLQSKLPPHSENWRAIHASTYKENEEHCKLCHKSSFCLNKCHQAHLPGWDSNHSQSASGNGFKKCMFCHYKEYCDNCHNKSVYK